MNRADPHGRMERPRVDVMESTEAPLNSFLLLELLR